MSDIHFFGNILGAIQDARSWADNALCDLAELDGCPSFEAVGKDLEEAIKLLERAAGDAELLKTVEEEDRAAEVLEALADANSY